MFFRKQDNSIFQLNFFNQRHVSYCQKIVAQTKGLDGVICECGVGAGFTLFNMISSEIYISRYKKTDPREIVAYDSFSGFPELTHHDDSKFNIKSGIRKGRGWVRSEKNFIAKMLRSKLPIEEVNLTLVKGFFNKTLLNPVNLPKKISCLHLDVDLHDSYKICLEILAPRVVPGGIIMVDEYLDQIEKFPGAVKAIDEYMKDKPYRALMDDFSGKYYFVKDAGL
jgi:O-methyltransferase